MANLTASLSFDLQKNYESFDKTMKIWTTDTDHRYRNSTEKHLKNYIKACASKTRRAYEDRAYPVYGINLLAGIFALLVIQKAGKDDTGGVQYNYWPHAAQIMVILLLLGISEDQKGLLKNRLAEIKTGEGKSIVLGGLACYLALVGFDVRCICYSRLLSRRDYEDFKSLFVELDVL